MPLWSFLWLTQELRSGPLEERLVWGLFVSVGLLALVSVVAIWVLTQWLKDVTASVKKSRENAADIAVLKHELAAQSHELKNLEQKGVEALQKLKDTTGSLNTAIALLEQKLGASATNRRRE